MSKTSLILAQRGAPLGRTCNVHVLLHVVYGSLSNLHCVYPNSMNVFLGLVFIEA